MPLGRSQSPNDHASQRKPDVRAIPSTPPRDDTAITGIPAKNA
jgi:hypothetical protein